MDNKKENGLHVSRLRFTEACNFTKIQHDPGDSEYSSQTFWSFVDKMKYSHEHNEKDIAPITFPYFYTSKKLMDMERSAFRLNMGFFASAKFLEFINELVISSYKPFEIFYKKRGKIYDDFCYIFFYSGLRQIIDFKKSTFSINHFHTNELITENVRVHNVEDFFLQNRKLILEFKHTLNFEKIYFYDSILNFDLFPIYLTGIDFYVSERFIEQFNIKKLTGHIDFIPETRFYIS